MENGCTPLRDYRRSNGKTLGEMAHDLSVKPRTIIRWEQGQVLIPIKRLEKIEDVTGIPRQRLRPDIFKSEAAE